MKEIKLTCENTYNNYYIDVTCWIELKGPDFDKRVYGFWNGGNNYIVQVSSWKTKSIAIEQAEKFKKRGLTFNIQ